MRWAIGFDFKYLSTGKASPNDSGIVIVIIIIVGEERLAFHGGGIIAQTHNWQEKLSEEEKRLGVSRRLRSGGRRFFLQSCNREKDRCVRQM
jgi:hypothetical protein